MAARRKRKFIKQAIKHPGALDREVGGPASHNLAKVEHLAKHGTPAERRRAVFYLKVLRPASRRRKRG